MADFDFPPFPLSRDYFVNLCSRSAYGLPDEGPFYSETRYRGTPEHPMFDSESRDDASIHELWYSRVQSELRLHGPCDPHWLTAHLSEERQALRTNALSAGEIDVRHSMCVGCPTVHVRRGPDFWSHGFENSATDELFPSHGTRQEPDDGVVPNWFDPRTGPPLLKPRSAIDGAWNYFPLHAAASSSDWSSFKLYASRGHSVLRESFGGTFPFDEWYRSLWDGRTLKEDRTVENETFLRKLSLNRFATIVGDELTFEGTSPTHTSVLASDLPLAGGEFDFSPAVIRLSLPNYYQDQRPTGDPEWDAIPFTTPGCHADGGWWDPVASWVVSNPDRGDGKWRECSEIQEHPALPWRLEYFKSYDPSASYYPRARATRGTLDANGNVHPILEGPISFFGTKGTAWIDEARHLEGEHHEGYEYTRGLSGTIDIVVPGDTTAREVNEMLRALLPFDDRVRHAPASVQDMYSSLSIQRFDDTARSIVASSPQPLEGVILHPDTCLGAIRVSGDYSNTLKEREAAVTTDPTRPIPGRCCDRDWPRDRSHLDHCPTYRPVLGLKGGANLMLVLPSGSTRVLTYDGNLTPRGIADQYILGVVAWWDNYDMVVQWRALDLDVPIAEQGVKPEDIIRWSGRLRGGGKSGKKGKSKESFGFQEDESYWTSPAGGSGMHDEARDFGSKPPPKRKKKATAKPPNGKGPAKSDKPPSKSAERHLREHVIGGSDVCAPDSLDVTLGYIQDSTTPFAPSEGVPCFQCLRYITCTAERRYEFNLSAFEDRITATFRKLSQHHKKELRERKAELRRASDEAFTESTLDDESSLPNDVSEMSLPVKPPNTCPEYSASGICRGFFRPGNKKCGYTRVQHPHSKHGEVGGTHIDPNGVRKTNFGLVRMTPEEIYAVEQASTSSEKETRSTAASNTPRREEGSGVAEIAAVAIQPPMGFRPRISPEGETYSREVCYACSREASRYAAPICSGLASGVPVPVTENTDCTRDDVLIRQCIFSSVFKDASLHGRPGKLVTAWQYALPEDKQFVEQLPDRLKGVEPAPQEAPPKADSDATDPPSDGDSASSEGEAGVDGGDPPVQPDAGFVFIGCQPPTQGGLRALLRDQTVVAIIPHHADVAGIHPHLVWFHKGEHVEMHPGGGDDPSRARSCPLQGPPINDVNHWRDAIDAHHPELRHIPDTQYVLAIFRRTIPGRVPPPSTWQTLPDPIIQYDEIQLPSWISSISEVFPPEMQRRLERQFPGGTARVLVHKGAERVSATSDTRAPCGTYVRSTTHRVHALFNKGDLQNQFKRLESVNRALSVSMLHGTTQAALFRDREKITRADYDLRLAFAHTENIAREAYHYVAPEDPTRKAVIACTVVLGCLIGGGAAFYFSKVDLADTMKILKTVAATFHNISPHEATRIAGQVCGLGAIIAASTQVYRGLNLFRNLTSSPVCAMLSVVIEEYLRGGFSEIFPEILTGSASKTGVSKAGFSLVTTIADIMLEFPIFGGLSTTLSDMIWAVVARLGVQLGLSFMSLSDVPVLRKCRYAIHALFNGIPIALVAPAFAGSVLAVPAYRSVQAYRGGVTAYEALASFAYGIKDQFTGGQEQRAYNDDKVEAPGYVVRDRSPPTSKRRPPLRSLPRSFPLSSRLAHGREYDEITVLSFAKEAARRIGYLFTEGSETPIPPFDELCPEEMTPLWVPAYVGGEEAPVPPLPKSSKDDARPSSEESTGESSSDEDSSYTDPSPTRAIPVPQHLLGTNPAFRLHVLRNTPIGDSYAGVTGSVLIEETLRLTPIGPVLSLVDAITSDAPATIIVTQMAMTALAFQGPVSRLLVAGAHLTWNLVQQRKREEHREINIAHGVVGFPEVPTKPLHELVEKGVVEPMLYVERRALVSWRASVLNHMHDLSIKTTPWFNERVVERSLGYCRMGGAHWLGVSGYEELPLGTRMHAAIPLPSSVPEHIGTTTKLHIDGDEYSLQEGLLHMYELAKEYDRAYPSNSVLWPIVTTSSLMYQMANDPYGYSALFASLRLVRDTHVHHISEEERAKNWKLAGDLLLPLLDSVEIHHELTIEECTKGFDASKRDNFFRARADMEAGIDVEWRNVIMAKTNETAAAKAQAFGSGAYFCCTANGTRYTLAPRSIFVVPIPAHVAMAPWSKAVTQAFTGPEGAFITGSDFPIEVATRDGGHKTVHVQIVFGSGKQGALSEMANSGSFIAVNGDDFLVHIEDEPDLPFHLQGLNAGDLSKCDATQTYASLIDLGERYLEKMGVPRDLPGGSRSPGVSDTLNGDCMYDHPMSVLHRVLVAQWSASGYQPGEPMKSSVEHTPYPSHDTPRQDNKGYMSLKAIKILLAMATGVDWTTNGNTVPVLTAILYVLRYGAGWLEGFAELGYNLKPKHVIDPQHPDDSSAYWPAAEYLKGCFARTADGRLVWTPLPGTICKWGKTMTDPVLATAMRKGTSDGRPRKLPADVAVHTMARAIASGYQHLPDDTPLAGAFLRVLRECSPHADEETLARFEEARLNRFSSLDEDPNEKYDPSSDKGDGVHSKNWDENFFHRVQLSEEQPQATRESVIECMLAQSPGLTAAHIVDAEDIFKSAIREGAKIPLHFEIPCLSLITAPIYGHTSATADDWDLLDPG